MFEDGGFTVKKNETYFMDGLLKNKDMDDTQHTVEEGMTRNEIISKGNIRGDSFDGKLNQV